MQEGISAEEACRTRSLATEDFARMCNQDGSLKTASQQTISVRQTAAPPSPNNTLWYIATVIFLVVFVLGIALIMAKAFRHRRASKEKAGHHPAVNKGLYLAALLIVYLPILLIAANYFYIGTYAEYIERTPDFKVGIVPGGGIESDKPLPLLQDRLDAAASLLRSGHVDKLIVSGDNRFDHYNEPEVMKEYLVKEKSIDPKRVYLDNAGRSTYETCERAEKVFSLDKAVLISENTHLPRAIYLCRSFGIEAYGYSSDGQSSAGRQVGQRFREILARTKAGINVYIIGERTVLGEEIKF